MIGNVATLNQLDKVFGSILSQILVLVGMAAVAMLVIGGYKYLMAGTDKDAATKAKNTITYIVIGLILAVAAWMIISLLGRFLGVDFGNFTVCFPGTVC